MSRINIPFDALASRLNLSGRFDGLQSQSLMSRVSSMKGLGDFFDFKRMSRPHNFGEIQARVNFNLSYFSSNYVAIFFMLTIYTLFSNLLLFFDIVFVLGGLWGIKKLDGRDLDLGFVRATTSQLYTALICIAVPVGFIANPFGAALWLIGASGVSILGHAAFMEKPIESAFGEEARRRKWGWKRPRVDGSPYALLDTAEMLDAVGVDAKEVLEDVLEFTGFDLQSARRSASTPAPGLLHNDEIKEMFASPSVVTIDDDDEHEELLVSSAKAKLRSASEQGQSHAIMTQEEAGALERYRQDQASARMWAPVPVPSPKRSATLKVAKRRKPDQGQRNFSSPVDRRPMAPRSPNSPESYSPYDPESRIRVPGSFQDLRAASLEQAPLYKPRSYSRPTEHRSASMPKPLESARSAAPLRARAASEFKKPDRPTDPRADSDSGPHTVPGRRNVSGPPEYGYRSFSRREPVLETIASPTRETYPDFPVERVLPHPVGMTPGFWALAAGTGQASRSAEVLPREGHGYQYGGDEPRARRAGSPSRDREPSERAEYVRERDVSLRRARHARPSLPEYERERPSFGEYESPLGRSSPVDRSTPVGRSSPLARSSPLGTERPRIRRVPVKNGRKSERRIDEDD